MTRIRTRNAAILLAAACAISAATVATATAATPRTAPAASAAPTLLGGGNGVLTPTAPPYTANQVGGADRYQTAIDASKLAWADVTSTSTTGAPHPKIAVLARGDTYADALAGSAMAAELGGPLLLTSPDALDANVHDELQRVMAAGQTVYLLGGPAALTPAVEKAVGGLGLVPKRIQGTDRFGTAVAIADAMAYLRAPARILVASGANYPDALVAGSTAASASGMTFVVLTDGATMPQATADYLARAATGNIEVYGIGGPGYQAASKLLGSRVIPLLGSDRYATAGVVAARFFTAATAPKVAGIAYGGNWPDALSGGALVGDHHGPLLLEDGTTLPGGQLDYLRQQGQAVTSFVAFGGPAVLAQSQIAAAATAANASAPWQYTVNPVDVPLP